MTEKCGAQYRGTLVSTLHFCEQPTGHTGAHLCRELMWWADDCTPAKAEAPPETGRAWHAEVVALVEALREPLPSGDYARGRSHMHAEILAALRDQARHG